MRPEWATRLSSWPGATDYAHVMLYTVLIILAVIALVLFILGRR